MMTPILPATVTTRRSYAQLLIGAILGCILTLAAIPATLTAEPPTEKRYAGCQFPQHDGEAVTWARYEGVVFCFEQRDGRDRAP